MAIVNQNGNSGLPREEIELNPNDNKLLVVDDDPVIRTLIQATLKQYGYDAVCVAEGEAAIMAYHAAYETGEPYLGVILDLHSHIGMEGDIALARIREINPDVKAVVCSGDVHHPVMTQYATYGFLGALPKPIDFSTLVELLVGVQPEMSAGC